MIFRIYPAKDTWITNIGAPFSHVPVTGSNFGASEILELFKTGVSGTVAPRLSASFARIISQFDLTDISSMTASMQAPASGISYRLVMFNARHAETLPGSYDVEILPVTASWDEGPGLDEDTFVDMFAANWIKRVSNAFWGTPGGDFGRAPGALYHFDTGMEDLCSDVTTLVGTWLTGGLANNGFAIRVSSTLEADGNDYYVKKFHSRQTNFLDRRPYIEARWDDSVRDDRANFVLDTTGTLYLYYNVHGQPTNIPGITSGRNCLTVRIVGVGGTVSSLSGSWTGQPGVYSASFALASGSYSGSSLSDVWYLGNRIFMTGNFAPTDDFAVSIVRPGQFAVAMPDLQNEYTNDELVRMRLFVRSKDYNPPVVNTASSDATGLVMTKAYYRIDNDRTLQQVVPFGTGSYQGGVDYTRLSYDGRGNYFNFFMSNLAAGEVYRIVFLFDADGQRQVLDGGFKFRIV